MNRAECAAPHAALYFEPTGKVTACCANSWFAFGQIELDGPPDSLRSIWDSVLVAEQRRALDSGDFSLGCDECAAGIRRGERGQVLAREFDRYWGQLDGAFPRYMDFALSNTCNLQCLMCNGELSSAIRSQREGRSPLPSPYGDRFFTELEEFLPHLSEVSFKGGEPFLARESRRIWDLLLELDDPPRVTVTTNGTHWNDRIEQYVRRLRMHVILSVDGSTATTVESIRIGTKFEELTENTERFRSAATESGGSLVLNYCLMPQNWHELGRFLCTADQRELYVHVIPVVAPDEFDLLQLPTCDLTEVTGSLMAEGARIEPNLGRNAEVWNEQVSRLQSELARRASEADYVTSPVHVRRPVPDLDALLEALRVASGAPVLEVEFEDGRVTATTCPSWTAGLLDVSGWIGVRADDLPARMAFDAGCEPPEMDVVKSTPSVLEVTMVFLGAAPWRAAVVAIREPVTGQIERVLLTAPERVLDECS